MIAIEGNPMKLLALSVFIVSLLAISTASANNYDVTNYVSSTSGSPLEVEGLSIALDDCNLRLNDIASVNGSNFNYKTTYYSPDGTIAGLGAQYTNQDTFVCKNMGFINEDTSLDGIYEGKIDITHTGTTDKITLGSNYQCTTTENYLDILIDSDEPDSYGNVVNRFMVESAGEGNLSAIQRAYDSNYNSCDSELTTASFTSRSGASSSTTKIDKTVVFYYPFNSSSGIASYNISLFNNTDELLDGSENCVPGPLDAYSNVHLFLVDVEAETYQTEYTEQADCSPDCIIGGSGQYLTGNLTNLETDKLYFLVLYVNYDDGTGGACSRDYVIYEPETVKINVFVYDANYVCGEWSECEDGVRVRNCEDPDEIAPDIVEPQVCFEISDITIDLGFEEFSEVADDTFICEKNWGLCDTIFGQRLETTTTYTPTGWYLSRNYATSVGGVTAALENYCTKEPDGDTGDYSLKCWSLPSGDEQPLEIEIGAGDDVYCGVYNTTRVPRVEGFFNGSLYIAYNLSLASPYIKLEWAHKKCSSAPIQYDYGDCFGCCGTKCYGDCNQTPTGEYKLIIADIGEGRTDYVEYDYNFTNHAGTNKTDAVAEANDLSYATVTHDWDASQWGTITLIDANFTDNITIAMFVQPNTPSKTVYITDLAGTTVYGSFDAGGSIVDWNWRNVTLSNVGVGVDNVYLHDGNGVASSFQVKYDKIVVEEYDTFIYVDTLVDDYVNITQEGWSPQRLDLSNLGIIVGHNYTVAFVFEPKYESTTSNCVLIDSVRGAYNPTVITEEQCITNCSGLDRVIRTWLNNACKESYVTNHPDCTGAEAGENFCVGDTLHFLDEEGNWDTLECNYRCADGECMSQEEYEEYLLQQQGTERQTTDEMLESAGALLFQLFTWALIITIISMLGSAILLGHYGNVKDVRPSLATGLGVNVFFIVAGWTPFWWGLMISAGLIILISGKIVDLSGVGGG